MRMHYNPVVDKLKDKYSVLCLETYRISKGGIQDRSLLESRVLGKVKTNPLALLSEHFPKFHITSFNGYDLFSGDDTNEDTPLNGLSIIPYWNEDINILLYNLLSDLDDASPALRKEPVSYNYFRRIMSNLRGSRDDSFHPAYKQMQFDRKQIRDALRLVMFELRTA